MKVAVIGGGVLGSLVSLNLVERGADVTIFDSSVRSNARASHGYRMAGVFWQNLALRGLMNESTDWWKNYLSAYSTNLSISRDMLEVFPDIASLESVESILKELNVEYERDLSTLFDGPNLNYPNAVHLINMDLFLEVANDDLYEGGAKFESKEIESNKELVALREDFDFIIVANGSWIGKFHELTGVGVRTTRQNWYQVVGSVDSEFPYLKDMRNSHRIVPDGNGLRLFNGAVGEEFEPTGVYKEDKQEVLSLQSYLETWFPGSKSQLVGNSCQYACSPDYLPVLTQAEGITFLCPPAGGGVKTGPRLAAACVRMALDEISEFPQFDVSRFESTAK